MLYRAAGLACAVFGLLVASVTVAVGQTTAPLTATADVRDAAGRQVAVADLRESQNEVLITLTFPAEAPLTGTHAIHIHERGRCTAPDFNDAGGIFNPLGRQHGLRNTNGPMVGDLPDLTLGPQGVTRYSIAAALARLAPGQTSLLGQGGTTLVIDAGLDDNNSQPSGNSGAHIACGVILAPGQSAAQAQGSSLFSPLVLGAVGLVVLIAGIALRLLSRRREWAGR